MKRWRWLRWVGQILLGLFLVGLLFLGGRLYAAARQPLDALLVLGGSIRREIFVTELVPEYPEAKVLISNGSQDPCIWAIFFRAKVTMDEVWLEKCARNTFGNFYFATPILQQWGAKHVKLITSQSHLPRAIWMARVHLGMRGIWVDLEVAEETGRPGNQEYLLKTILDVGRSVLWAAIAPLLNAPTCDRVIPLTEVDMRKWLLEERIKCEHQAQIEPTLEQLRREFEEI